MCGPSLQSLTKSILWSGPGPEYLRSNLSCRSNKLDQIAKTIASQKVDSGSRDLDDRRLLLAACRTAAPEADARSHPEQLASRAEYRLTSLER